MFSTNALYGLSIFCLIKSTVNFTSLEVNVVPSCHLISFSLISVSYTHLDVYKRQIQIRIVACSSKMKKKNASHI